jgi:flagellin FlaB
MRGIFNIFRKDDRAFTGLESAIVLTAFVVVAAVFSYVVLGAGFTTSDTAKKTIDEGVKQTTSSVELAGDVIAKGTSTPGSASVDYLLVTLQLTAGQSPVDIGDNNGTGKMIVSYTDNSTYIPDIQWTSTFIGANDTDKVLEQHERVELNITIPASTTMLKNNANSVNREFRLELKPSVGAIVPITRITPPQIDGVMNLR